MYVRANSLGNVGDIKSFLKKTRDVIHKAFPRELSPTRLLEDYQSKQKKKAAEKAAKQKFATELQTAEQKKQLLELANQTANLQSFAPTGAGNAGAPGVGLPGASGFSSVPPILIAGGIAAVLATVYLLRKKR